MFCLIKNKVILELTFFLLKELNGQMAILLNYVIFICVEIFFFFHRMVDYKINKYN